MSSGKLLNKLQTLSRSPGPGPSPVFSYIHLCRALLTIGDEGPLGRIELSRKLSLGEGAVRTIMRRLTQAELITTVKDGSALTKRGYVLHSQLRRKLSKTFLIDAKQLALNKISASVLVRGSGHLVKKGIEQRDAAIRAGATGACTLVVRQRKYVMPMADDEEWRLDSKDPLAQDLENAFHPKENDVVTIISAPNRGLAENGAMAAAMTLLD